MGNRTRKIAEILGRANHSTGKMSADTIDVSFENVTDTGTEGTKIAVGTTAQRGSTQGQYRFNTTTGYFEGYNGTSFVALAPTPTIASVSPDNVESAGGGTVDITIQGTNFDSGTTVTFTANNGTTFNANSVTLNSSIEIVATATESNFSNALEPYDVTVTASSGLQGKIEDVINVDNAPTWSTASGTIATINDNATGTHATVSATDPDGDTVSYSETGGTVLSTNNLSLNSSTGAISGDPVDVNASTTHTFTLRATANSKTADRSFNIIVNPFLDGQTEAKATTLAYLKANSLTSDLTGIWLQAPSGHSGTGAQQYDLYWDSTNSELYIKLDQSWANTYAAISTPVGSSSSLNATTISVPANEAIDIDLRWAFTKYYARLKTIDSEGTQDPDDTNQFSNTEFTTTITGGSINSTGGGAGNNASSSVTATDAWGNSRTISNPASTFVSDGGQESNSGTQSHAFGTPTAIHPFKVGGEFGPNFQNSGTGRSTDWNMLPSVSGSLFSGAGFPHGVSSTSKFRIAHRDDGNDEVAVWRNFEIYVNGS